MKPCVVKQYLTEALFRLMEKKDFKNISVKELVTVAGVCRASFYRNYLSMESIVDEYFEATFSEIFSKNHSSLSNNQMDENNVQSVIQNVFSEIKLRRKTFELLQRQKLLDRMDKYLFEKIIDRVKEIGVLNNRYHPHFFAGAAVALVKTWIEYGFEESVGVMAEILFKSLKDYL